jgi:hypothetical protein
MTRFNVVAWLMLTPALLTPHAARAAESYDNCTGFITSLPAVISSEGTWCFNHDLNTTITSGQAITVATDNVVVDCNDFKLSGPAGSAATTAYGIFSFDHLNTTVRHCNIRFFYIGVGLIGANGGGHAVEDNRIQSDTNVGIWAEGDGSVVRRNSVYYIGGSTQNADAIGVKTKYSVDVMDNRLSGVPATAGANGNAFGIYTSANLHGRIIGNSVYNLAKNGTGLEYAIYNNDSDRITLRENEVFGTASAGSIGLRCANANGSAAENFVNGFAVGMLTCTDGGGNDVTP